ncbi:MAG: hypothetical protein JG765_1843 [Cereibacter sp.]|jgi:ABC-type Fe3+/spermidine/putrescine transport system ATPase subunit|nr:hypothetical protein [Cereibacter sp.]
MSFAAVPSQSQSRSVSGAGLEIADLTRRLGGQTILAGVSLQVARGEVACIVGPSGCGKSTLLRLVAGLDRPDAGEVRLDGRLLSGAGWAMEPQKRRTNMVFQDYALWPHMTVEAIVGYGLHKLPVAERRAKVAEWLERLRITPLARRLPAQISGGQQQRVAIARALATAPDLLLLDEPLSNLDVQLRAEMRRDFARLFSGLGQPVLYVTHDAQEAAAFADRLVVMKAGRIEQEGPPEAVFGRPASPWVAALAGYDIRLSGQAVAADGSGWRVAFGEQLLWVQGVPLLAEGRPVIVMLRGDPRAVRAVTPQAPAPEDWQQLSGQVTGSLLESGDWRADVAIGDPDRPAAVIGVLLPDRPRIGTMLTLAIAPGTMLAFAAENR